MIVDDLSEVSCILIVEMGKRLHGLCLPIVFADVESNLTPDQIDL